MSAISSIPKELSVLREYAVYCQKKLEVRPNEEWIEEPPPNFYPKSEYERIRKRDKEKKENIFKKRFQEIGLNMDKVVFNDKNIITIHFATVEDCKAFCWYYQIGTNIKEANIEIMIKDD